MNFAPDIRAVASIQAVPVILRMVKHLTGMRFAAVARVTDTHWVTCAVDDSISFGLTPGAELVLESTICDEIRQHREPVVFGHASEHPLWSTHHTPRLYEFQSYISIPILCKDGSFFGTLCAIDPAPHNIETPEILETLTLFAQLIGANLDMQASVDASQAELAQSMETGRLRDQFIAVLGHDLRTPLSAIRMSSELLGARLAERPERRLVTAIRESALRMGALIENVLDFARGRLGGGIPVERRAVARLDHALSLVINEVRNSHRGARIEQSLNIPASVVCDPVRVGQLLSNLLGNAVVHGSADAPVHVQASVAGGELVMSVTNQGTPIPANLMPLLFEPYSRSEVNQHAQGLGLGLYIAREIAKGHGGSISVTSTQAGGTCFVARFPVLPAPAKGG